MAFCVSGEARVVGVMVSVSAIPNEVAELKPIAVANLQFCDAVFLCIS